MQSNNQTTSASAANDGTKNAAANILIMKDYNDDDLDKIDDDEEEEEDDEEEDEEEEDEDEEDDEEENEMRGKRKRATNNNKKSDRATASNSKVKSIALNVKSSKQMSGGRAKKTKGRVKIKMEYIEDKIRRYTTFSKRKTGIMKKAYELSTLTGTQVMLLVASETGHVYTYATEKLKPIFTSEAGTNLIKSCLANNQDLEMENCEEEDEEVVDEEDDENDEDETTYGYEDQQQQQDDNSSKQAAKKKKTTAKPKAKQSKRAKSGAAEATDVSQYQYELGGQYGENKTSNEETDEAKTTLIIRNVDTNQFQTIRLPVNKPTIQTSNQSTSSSKSNNNNNNNSSAIIINGSLALNSTNPNMLSLTNLNNFI